MCDWRVSVHVSKCVTLKQEVKISNLDLREVVYRSNFLTRRNKPLDNHSRSEVTSLGIVLVASIVNNVLSGANSKPQYSVLPGVEIKFFVMLTV